MDKDVAQAVVDWIIAGNTQGISFFGGEPTVNWPIVEYILNGIQDKKDEPSKMRGTHTNITTNGTLLTPKRIDFLAEHKVHINLSFDGLPETQNKFRDGSYDKVIKNIDAFVGYPNLQVLKTGVSIPTLYEDVKHIKDLGFKRMYINLLDPYSRLTYEDVSVKLFKEQYRKVLSLIDDNFKVADYYGWRRLCNIDQKGIGCGYSNRGLCVDPVGDFYPCHEAPSMGPDFIIGNIWDGVDKERARKVRKVPNAPQCESCSYKFTKCYVSMYHKHHSFGHNPPEWYTKIERAKIRIIEDLAGIQPREFYCENPKALLLATLFSSDKTYLLKSFLKSIHRLTLPLATDYVMLVDDYDNRLYTTLRKWLEGKVNWLPNLGKKFRTINLIRVPTVPGEGYMSRITRARNMVLGIARSKDEYHAYMFIDSDMLVRPNTYVMLNNVKADIVGALVKCRRDDKEGWYNNYRSTKDGGYRSVQKFERNQILDVDATGSDCILVRRNVFMGQQYTWKPEIPEAEDMGFCKKAKERGLSIRVHTGIKTTHIEPKHVEVR